MHEYHLHQINGVGNGAGSAERHVAHAFLRLLPALHDVYVNKDVAAMLLEKRLISGTGDM